jgi:hypothetical protein
MKTRLPISFSLLLVILPVVIAMSLSSCAVNDDSAQKGETNGVETAINNENEIKTPTGNELKIEAQRETTNEYLVKVTNISEGKVYCNYQMSPRAALAGMHYSPQKRKPNGAEFEAFHNAPDSFPPLKAIHPGQTVVFRYGAFEKGEYRLMINYMIDENVAELLASKSPFEYDDAERQLRSKAERQAATPVLEITEDK